MLLLFGNFLGEWVSYRKFTFCEIKIFFRDTSVLLENINFPLENHSQFCSPLFSVLKIRPFFSGRAGDLGASHYSKRWLMHTIQGTLNVKYINIPWKRDQNSPLSDVYLSHGVTEPHTSFLSDASKFCKVEQLQQEV